MSWANFHELSERAAVEAEMLHRARQFGESRQRYAQAARYEVQAYVEVGPDKPRTLGIVAVSAASLWFKARQFREAEAFVHVALAAGNLPEFAQVELKTVLQTVWTEAAKDESHVSFLPGQVLVSIRGGEVVTGGAPLDLIVDKVKGIQSLFYRTMEHLKGFELRTRGAPLADIASMCRPWLFQAPPGSYQFSIVIQGEKQLDLLDDMVEPPEIVEHFLAVLQASTGDDPRALEAIVPEKPYRVAFLKLARNLVPKGKAFSALEVKSADSSRRVEVGVGAQERIRTTLKAEQPAQRDEQVRTVQGVLRALHLDKDWLQVDAPNEQVLIHGVQDSLDDVIGAMVNRRVVAKYRKFRLQNKLVDIELDE